MRNRCRAGVLSTLAALVVTALAPLADAAPLSATFGYSGVLVGDAEWYQQSLPAEPFVFRLCTSEAGTCAACTNPPTDDCVWQEEWSAVPVEGGHFTVELGKYASLPVDRVTQGAWLQVEHAGQVLSPRTKLAAVPVALACYDAATLSGKEPTAFAPAVHDHDDRYHGKAEVDDALAQKAAVGDSFLKAESDAKYAAKWHTHDIGAVDGLQAALDGKENQGVAYSKAETDARLAGKANTGDSFSKAESDGRYAALTHSQGIATVDGLQDALNGKENAGVAYAKDQVDTKLGGKADVGASYLKAESDGRYYTKTDVDSKLAGKADTLSLAKLRAYRSTTLSVPTNTDTKVVFNAVNFKANCQYDQASGHFSAISSGYYLIHVAAQWPGGNKWATKKIKIFVNGVERANNKWVNYGESTDNSQNITDMEYLNAGDYVYATLFQTVEFGNAVNLVIGSEYTYMAITQLP